MRVKVATTTFLKAAGAAFGIGLDDEGHRVEFMGDRRMMHALAESIADGETVYADVESWQVIAVDGELRVDLSPAAMAERGEFVRSSLP